MPLIEKIRKDMPFFAPLKRGKIKRSSCFVQYIITMMDGGLASQMRQHALGRGVVIRSGLPVLYDDER